VDTRLDEADAPVGPLADGPRRDYVRKLELFGRFAEAELRSAIAWLAIPPGARVLDAGCGAGLQSRWLAEAVAPDGTLLAVDVSPAHAQAARAQLRESPVAAAVRVSDLSRLELPSGSLDLVWCSNTLNHMPDPEVALRRWREWLSPQGRVAVAQSSFLPDMVFAWNARLEGEVTRACREYYRQKYGLTEASTAGMRNVVGYLQRSGFRDVTARTFVIERVSPLRPSDVEYVLEAVFRGYWGEKVRPYLSDADWRELERLCDPESPEFALARPDFHLLMTYTVAFGRTDGR
jgi:ubiquinone/menaquinone biosynthesis C-methylase UbiE